MALKEAKEYLEQRGYGDRIREFEVSLSLIHISEPTRRS